MASHASTPRSPSRSSTSSASSDTTMLDAPPLAPAQPRRASHPSSSSSRPNKDAAFSLLLSLPRELRDRIYNYALISQFPFWWPNPAPVRHNLALGILTTSRQVYEEAAPILYAGNKFLFTHPSDCNIFRIVASPKYSALIQLVFFKIREKDLRLWTTYLGSKTQERSLKQDLPKLRSLWIFLRCGSVGTPGALAGHGIGGVPPHLAAQVQAVQHALGQQVHALQQQVHHLTQAVGAVIHGAAGQQAGLAANPNGNANGAALQPPPAPVLGPTPFIAYAQNLVAQTHHQHLHPPPGQPHAHGVQTNHPPNPSPLAVVHQQQQQQQQQQQPPNPPLHHHGPFYASLLRWEREIGLENLCLSLQETKPAEADVKVVCIMRLPKPEVTRLCRVYPEELNVDRNGDARTRFRRLHGVDVSLELSGFDIPGVIIQA